MLWRIWWVLKEKTYPNLVVTLKIQNIENTRTLQLLRNVPRISHGGYGPGTKMTTVTSSFPACAWEIYRVRNFTLFYYELMYVMIGILCSMSLLAIICIQKLLHTCAYIWRRDCRCACTHGLTSNQNLCTQRICVQRQPFSFVDKMICMHIQFKVLTKRKFMVTFKTCTRPIQIWVFVKFYVPLTCAGSLKVIGLGVRMSARGFILSAGWHWALWCLILEWQKHVNSITLDSVPFGNHMCTEIICSSPKMRGYGGQFDTSMISVANFGHVWRN